MNYYNKIRFRSIIFLFMLSLLISGCASFINKEPPNYTSEQLQPMPNKSSVDYDIKSFNTFHGYGEIPQELFEQHVDKNFSQSNLFSKFNAGVGGADYHFSFSMDQKRYFFTGIATALISGLTLTILPTYAPVDYALIVDVSKGDKFIKRYEYDIRVTLWVELFLVVKTASHSIFTAPQKALDQMLIAFLHDFRKDVDLAH